MKNRELATQLIEWKSIVPVPWFQLALDGPDAENAWYDTKDDNSKIHYVIKYDKDYTRRLNAIVDYWVDAVPIFKHKRSIADPDYAGSGLSKHVVVSTDQSIPNNPDFHKVGDAGNYRSN